MHVDDKSLASALDIIKLYYKWARIRQRLNLIVLINISLFWGLSVASQSPSLDLLIMLRILKETVVMLLKKHSSLVTAHKYDTILAVNCLFFVFNGKERLWTSLPGKLRVSNADFYSKRLIITTLLSWWDRSLDRLPLASSSSYRNRSTSPTICISSVLPIHQPPSLDNITPAPFESEDSHLPYLYSMGCHSTWSHLARAKSKAFRAQLVLLTLLWATGREKYRQVSNWS